MAHPVLRGKRPDRSGITRNCDGLICGKFGLSASLSTIACAVRHAILLILGRRVPAQIDKPGVFPVAVVMASLGAFWPFADKGLQNQKVNRRRLVDSVLHKINRRIAARNVPVLQYSLFSGDMSDLAVRNASQFSAYPSLA